MQELEVPCVTVDDILKEHRVRQNSEWVGMTSDMVILSVDAEGFDPYILQSVDFDRLRPKLIVFEHQHLIPKNWNRHGRIQELRDVLAMLARHRYFCARDVENHWCLGGLDMPVEDFCRCFGECSKVSKVIAKAFSKASDLWYSREHAGPAGINATAA